MPVQVSISESITRGRAPSTLSKVAEEGILLRDYLLANISIGELKEAMGMKYMEDVHDWLHSLSIPIIRQIRDPELAAIEKANFKKIQKDFFPKKSK